MLPMQYFSEYEDAINHITQVKGAYALIDPHNYMRYKYATCHTYSRIIAHEIPPHLAILLHSPTAVA